MPLEHQIRRLRWYRDQLAWQFIVLAYLPLLAALNLFWEMAQLPLYTIWSEASMSAIAFAVAHCTAGDVMIGGGALFVALVATRAGPINQWKWLRIGLGVSFIGLTYTALSEWMNTAVKSSWEYSALMPTLAVHGVQIGLSPLAQWLIVPPFALLLARRIQQRRAHR